MFEQKKILILGMGRSGYECAKLLSKYSHFVTITDQKDQDQKHVEELQSLGVSYVVTDDPCSLLTDDIDFLIKNPGIISTHPCVQKAKEKNISVINEVEVAYEFLKENKIIGITGSNGKTTTTTMIYEVMKKSSLPVLLGGNIGYPVCSLVEKANKESILVLEISDHQLVDVQNFKTNISVLTNISQVHLDFHKDFDTYKRMKRKIFAHHTNEDFAIINAENQDSLLLTEDIDSYKEYFSSKKRSDCFIQDGKIMYQNEEIVHVDDIKVKGMHNYENIMCMIMVVKKFGVSNEIIQAYLKEFKGVEHRIEYVDEIQGVFYYNDSKATNTDSTIIALDSFLKPTILLLGGLDRGHSFEPLIPSLKNTKKIIAYGETRQRILTFAESQNIECEIVETLEEATKLAIKDSQEGDVVLLSPACASWDQFEDFEKRGNLFKRIISQYKEEQ